MTEHTDTDLVWLPVRDAGAVGTVRRAATAIAAELGLPEDRSADLAIVASELASNLYKHADEGVVLVRAVRRAGQGGVEIVAIDKGPGMSDPVRSAADGQSTSGTLGIGLGAIRRQSSEHALYSWPGSGTVSTATVWAAAVPPSQPTAFQARGISRPMGGEQVTGDGYGIRTTDRGYLQLMLCDGLGHGSLAAVAAQAAEAAFRDGAAELGPKAMLERIHGALNHTRGAVVTVVELDSDREVARFAGLGNVSGSVIDGLRRRMMVSQPGIAGHQRPPIRELEIPCPLSAIVVLHSDGVTDRWNLSDYPGLMRQPPLLIAATLLRDAGVRRDDAAVLVARAAP